MQELLFCPALSGDGFHKICIVDIEDDNVFVAAVGHDGESAQLIAEYTSSDFYNGHEDNVSPGVERFLGEWFHSVNWFKVGWECWWVSCWGGGLY